MRIKIIKTQQLLMIKIKIEIILKIIMYFYYIFDERRKVSKNRVLNETVGSSIVDF